MDASPGLNPDIQRALHAGVVIPAHPLALTESRRLDEHRQQALARYYLAAGAGGVAVGVHWCLDPNEGLSPGQFAEIDRVLAAYPSLNDDAFVRRHLDTWLPQ